MPDLIAVLSTGKGTWGHVNRLIIDGKWDNTFLITNEFGKENFTPEKKSEFIVIDSRKGINELREDIENALKPRVKGTEVAVNFISGTGREHMALIAALLRLGVGIRMVALTKDGIKEL